MASTITRQEALGQIAPLEQCAILVIDVQNEFCSAGGAFHRGGRDLVEIRHMLPNLSAFLNSARALGAKIVFFKHEYEPERLTPFMQKRKILLFGEDGYPRPGTWGAELCTEITPHPGEPILTKYWYSAFSNPELERILSAHRIHTLIMSGVLSNVCVETTLRDADTRDYFSIVVSDCVASDVPELHQATLANVAGYFGWVCEARELLDIWTGRQR